MSFYPLYLPSGMPATAPVFGQWTPNIATWVAVSNIPVAVTEEPEKPNKLVNFFQRLFSNFGSQTNSVSSSFLLCPLAPILRSQLSATILRRQLLKKLLQKLLLRQKPLKPG